MPVTPPTSTLECGDFPANTVESNDLYPPDTPAPYSMILDNGPLRKENRWIHGDAIPLYAFQWFGGE